MSEHFWRWYDRACESLDRYGVARAELDWLVQTHLGIDRLHLRLRDVVVGDDRGIDALWQRRLHDRVPVQYLVGRVQWRGMDLLVSPAVLIPRPETELLVEIVDGLSPVAGGVGHRLGVWVDMGTGSGAIAIGLAKVMPSAEVHGVDISAEALQVARLNAQRQGVEVHFHQGSWYGAIPQLAGRVTGIVANPPYIPSKEIGALAREVRCHEPLLALDGGERGLDGIMRLLADAPLFVVRGGYVVLEVMAGQAAIVKGALERLSDFRGVQVYRDLEMVERFVVARVA